MTSSVLGYDFFSAGLNNQKLALYGLVLSALIKGPKCITLPRICNYDLRLEDGGTLTFGQVFDAQPFAAFAERHGITIRWDETGFGSGGHFFLAAPELGGSDFPEGRIGPNHLLCDFYRALVPHSRRSPILTLLARRVFQQLKIKIVAQFRLEADWVGYCNTALRDSVGEQEDNCPSFHQIVDKIKRTLPGWEHGIFVVCDEAMMPVPKDEIRAQVLAQQGVKLYWKSDIVPAKTRAELKTVEASILDFEMATLAPMFVGLSRSSFSNLVTLDVFSRTRQHVRSHYIYNVRGPELGRRLDNGLHVVADLAVLECSFAGLDPTTVPRDEH